MYQIGPYYNIKGWSRQFWLDRVGWHVRSKTITALQSLVNPRYALLDPTLPDQGPYRARWRLRLNLDPEELKAIVWT